MAWCGPASSLTTPSRTSNWPCVAGWTRPTHAPRSPWSRWERRKGMEIIELLEVSPELVAGMVAFISLAVTEAIKRAGLTKQLLWVPVIFGAALLYAILAALWLPYLDWRTASWYGAWTGLTTA